MSKRKTEALLFEADGLCSLIYYRERSGLSAQTQEDLRRLCVLLRAATKQTEEARRA